jgi:hypothetical protein
MTTREGDDTVDRPGKKASPPGLRQSERAAWTDAGWMGALAPITSLGNFAGRGRSSVKKPKRRL